MRTNQWLALALSAATLPAQQLLWEREGVADLTTLGRFSYAGGIFVGLGDVNGDGYDDVLANAGDLPSSTTQLWVLSGRDGATLRIVPQAVTGFPYVIIAAAGDMDQDGVPDYATTIINQWGQADNVVEVRSGRDDSVLWQVQRPWAEAFGLSLLGGVDLDADGRPDLVATSPSYWTGGRYGAVSAYKNDGTLLWQVIGTPQLLVGAPPLRRTLGAVGDVDGDGAYDIVVGGLDAQVFAGAAIVLSGRSGQILRIGLGPIGGPLVGELCDGCGDLDGDGVPDFAGAAISGDLVMAFSGKTGAELYRWQGALNLGTSLRAGGLDFDLDGVPDLVSGAPSWILPTGRRGAVFAFSGRDGSQLLRVDRPPETFRTWFGAELDVLPPQPGNPFPLVVIGDPESGSYESPRYGGQYLGKIRAYRTAPPGVQPVGTACAGTLSKAPRIGMTGLGPLGAQGARVHLSDAPAGALALLLIGQSNVNWGLFPLPLSLASLGFPGCDLAVSIDAFGVIATGVTGVALGHAALDIPLPLQPSCAVSLYGQWLVLGPDVTAPGGLTAALAWRH